MKWRITIVILVLLIGISACKKSSTPPVTLVKIIAYAPVGGPDVTDTFYYNANHWVTSIKGSDGSLDTFANSGNMVTELQYNPSSVLTYTSTYYLNSKSLVDSSVLYNNASPNYVHYKNYYDVNGYLIKSTRYNNVNTSITIYTYTIKNNNIDSVIATQPTGGYLQSATANLFTTDYTNSIGSENTGQPYLGKSSANVIASSVTYQVSNNNTTVTNYTYTYDATGNIASQTTRVGAILAGTTSYTYY